MPSRMNLQATIGSCDVYLVLTTIQSYPAGTVQSSSEVV